LLFFSLLSTSFAAAWADILSTMPAEVVAVGLSAAGGCLPAPAAGDTIYNLSRYNDLEVGEDDRPAHPPVLTRADVLWNPFDDLKPRVDRWPCCQSLPVGQTLDWALFMVAGCRMSREILTC
jgi:hypothetical protein